MKRIDNDRGQAAVITVMFLATLLGAVAMVLDVGSWFREQRDTQADADASALAAAHELPESPGAASGLAAEFLGKNGGGTSTVTFSSTNLANDTVTVKVTREAPGVFSKLFGINSVSVHGQATARAGNPDQARWAAPIAVDIKHPLLQCKPCPASAPRRRSTSRKSVRAHSACSTSTSPTAARAARSMPTGSCAATTVTCRSTGTDPIPVLLSTTASSMKH